jgi:alkanesulfonate monooxygenase SsuD/methylene tetrahydromethanopterin reductase-like flavin-dependent oxidoreductase (luciferase family)
VTIYVDTLTEWPNANGLWCHMATDGDLDELHAMADRVGLKRAWFQDHPRVPHYDLRPSKRRLAVAAGAVEVGPKELLAVCRRGVNRGHRSETG